VRTRLLLLACLLALAAAPAAHASTRQISIFQDDGQLLHRGAAARDAALDEIATAGADVVKINLAWADIAPTGDKRPEGLVAQDPASYPDSAWERYDGAVRAAVARGLRVLVAVTTPAPGWATGARGDAAGVYRPNAREYGRFVRAVATRYDGAHGQPRVSLWSILNEPNHPDFLQPQGTRSGRLLAPGIYRELVRQGVAGLRLAGHGRDTILFGELMPRGYEKTGARNPIQPVAFLRELFCLDSRLRPYRGGTARRHGCSRFRRVTGVTGFAYHPYTFAGGPRVRETSPDAATIRSIGRVTRVLDRAASLRRLSRRRIPVWNTEFGYQTNPPDPHGSPIARVPGYLNEAEWMSYRNPRLVSWSQYALLDDSSGAGDFGGFQSGLRFENGEAKPGVYQAYLTPLFVRRLGSRTIEVWGGARAARAGQPIAIEARTRSSDWRELRTVSVGSSGYIRLRLRVSSPTRRVYRLAWSDGGVMRTSREAKAVTG
jgi:hypothetical protein